MNVTTMDSGMVMPMARVGLRLRRKRKISSMANMPPTKIFFVLRLKTFSIMRDMSSHM